MKLIEILVQELPKRGGWPSLAKKIHQDYDGEVWGWIDEGDPLFIFTLDQIATNARQQGKDETYENMVTREQYEAALAKNDGWIEWGGGECPVHESANVDIKLEDGSEKSDAPASAFIWQHDDDVTNIIAYRLHKPDLNSRAKDDILEQDLNECIGQAPATVWNGDGFPPVGMEIEYKFAKANYRTDFSRGKVLAYGMHNVFMEHWASKNEFIQPLDKIEFRPIRSEADRKREEAIMSLAKSGGAASFEYGEKFNDGSLIGAAWYELYDAIAAGKVRGVKLED